MAAILIPIAIILLYLFYLEINKISNSYVEKFGFNHTTIRTVAGRYSRDTYSKKGCIYSFSFIRTKNSDIGDNSDAYCEVWESPKDCKWLTKANRKIYTKREFKDFINSIEE